MRMDSSETKQVLMTRVEANADKQAALLLRGKKVDIHRVPWDDNTLDLVQTTPFDIILVGYPVASGSLRRFLKCVRAPGSACRRSGIILLADHEQMSSATAFIGHGVNRAIADTDVERLLVPTVDDLAGVAPRLVLRAPTRIVIQVEDHPVRAFCQTENLSLTGMLLRGFGHYPSGTEIKFEINIAGESDPIRGFARIARTTNVAVERVEGVGASFLSFFGSDKSRLSTYLEGHIH